MTLTEQNTAALNEMMPHDRAELAAALRELSEKINSNIEKQNEALMRLGYSTTTLNSAATDTLAAAKLLGSEQKKLAEIVARPAPLMRQRIYVTGALFVGLMIGLVGPVIVDWISN
jgi:hypothetical protein